MCELTTYEDVLRAQVERDEALKRYSDKCEKYLISCLRNAGLDNVLVISKSTKCVGVLRVEKCSSSVYPYEVKFYPITKSGNISMKSKGVPRFYGFSYRNMQTNLIECFAKVVGDT